jgi:type IV pilus assembly protein PilA
MLQRIRNRKGFTLVELMIVVAIIGILAAIAIPNFLQFRLKAKTSEAKSNLGAIRSTEVAYFAEWNFWVGNQAETPRAQANLDGAKAAWDTTTRFTIIGFAPEGAVFYSYSLDGNDFDTTAFTAHALGDLDDDGTVADFYVGTNNNEIAKTGGEF